MTTIYRKVLEEPLTPSGYKPSEIAALERTDPAKAKSIRAMNEARENPECAPLVHDMARACRAALRRDGIALMPAEEDADIAAVSAANPASLDQTALAEVKSLTAQLRTHGWDG